MNIYILSSANRFIVSQFFTVAGRTGSFTLGTKLGSLYINLVSYPQAISASAKEYFRYISTCKLLATRVLTL